MVLVSVIMPAYNGTGTIRKALASIQAQTYTSIEIVVVDDQSTDGTYELLREIAAQDHRLKLCRTPRNLGAGGARKMAMEHVTGDWITIMDTDDWCEPNRIEAMLNAALSLGADMVIDNLQIFDHAQGKIVRRTCYCSARKAVQLSPQDVFRMDNPLRQDSIGYCKPLTRSAFLRAHGLTYWGQYRNNEDFIFLTETMLCGAMTFVIPEAYYIYRHRVSPTTRKISPTSHSAHDTSVLIAQATDELLEKYKLSLSTKSRGELLRRKKIFLTSHVAGLQTILIRQGRIAPAMALFIKWPSLWNYRAIGFFNRLRRALYAVQTVAPYRVRKR